MIVPANTNSTVDNAYLSAENSYKYYNEFMWNGRYAECISFEKTLELMNESENGRGVWGYVKIYCGVNKGL